MDNTEILTLLQIVEGCAGHGGKLSAIANEAMAQLTELNEEYRQAAAERAKEAKVAEAEEAKAKAEAAAKEAKAEAEKKPAPSRTATIADDNARRL